MIGKNVRHWWKLLSTNVRVAARFDVLIEKGVTLKYDETLRFGRHCTLQSGAYLYGSRAGNTVEFEDFVVIAAGATVLGEGGVRIGSYTHLGPGAVLTTQYGDSSGERQTPHPRLKTAPIHVGRGCWIGSRAVLMPGVELGDDCVVAPGSVVYGKWPSGSTLGGNPARRAQPLVSNANNEARS